MVSFAHSVTVLLMFSVSSSANGDVFTTQQQTDLINFVNTLMHCRDTVGLAIAVVKGNETWTRGFGMADREAGLGVSTSDLFCIGSLSKAFTSAIISIFLNQTRHSWDTPVVDILGEDFQFATEELTRQVTLKDILSHRTGLENNDLPLHAGSLLTRPQYASAIRYLPVKKPFRDEFDYNNWMYSLAGYVAEKLGGSPWEDLVHTHLFAPLGMTRSGVLGQTVSLTDDRLTAPYVLYRSQVVLSDRSAYRITPKEAMGAVVSSADDMTKWMQLLLNEGRTPDGRQLLTAAHWREMSTPHTPLQDSSRARANLAKPQFPALYATDSYGLGWFIANYRGYPMVWHSGRIYAYTTYLGIISGLDLAVFVTSNGPNGKNPGHIIRQLFFYIADLVLGEDPWLNTANACQYPELWRRGSSSSSAGAASNTTTTCDDHTFNNTFRFLGSYEHQLYGRVDITREGPHGLYARYNRLEGQLCRTEMEHVALYQVVGKMAFIFHAESSLTYLRLNFSRPSADGSYREVSMCLHTDTENVLVFQRDSTAACRGDHANDTRVVILLLAAAFFSVGMS